MKFIIGQRGVAQLSVLIGLLLMAVVLPLVGMQVGNNQDIRNRATGTHVCSETTRPKVSCVKNGVTYGWTCNTGSGVWECVVTTPIAVVSLIPTPTNATGCTCGEDTDWKFVGTCPGEGTSCITPTLPPTQVPVAGVTGCFLPGTSVSTVNGDKKIEDVKVGDKVLSFDNQNKLNNSEVSKLMSFSRDYYYRLVAGDSEVKVTAEHPFYRGNGEFTQVKDLRIGDEVYLLRDGKMVKEVVFILQRVDEKTGVYNITVEEDHTYFANRFAVHNKNTVAIPPQGLICSQGDIAWNKCQAKAGSGGVLYDNACPGGYTDKGKVYTWVYKTTIAGKVFGDCITKKCCVSNTVTESQKLDACNKINYTVNTTNKLGEVTINGVVIKPGGKHTFSARGWLCDSSKTDGSCARSAAVGIPDINSKEVTVTNSQKCKVGKTYSGYCCPRF